MSHYCHSQNTGCMARADCDLNEAVRTQEAAESEASSEFVMQLDAHIVFITI